MRCGENELTAAAAVRAIKEELGVDATVEAPLGEHTYTAHDPVRGAVERTVAYFLSTVAAVCPLKCKVCEGITDARWYTDAELTSLPIYEDLRAIIDAGLKRVRSV